MIVLRGAMSSLSRSSACEDWVGLEVTVPGECGFAFALGHCIFVSPTR